MGSEVVEQALPSFERKWDRAFKEMCGGGLFDREPLLGRRRFSALPVGTPVLTRGRDYQGQLHGGELKVLHLGSVVATVSLPLEEQNRVRNEGYGAAIVHVEEDALPISGVADVSIR